MRNDDSPNCRAAIRDGTVTLNRWTRGMAERGPVKEGLRYVSAALADLHKLDEHELIVAPVRGVPWDAHAEAALLEWAARVGYRRVWLPQRVVELDELALLGCASVICPTCGARWQDDDLSFWEAVRRSGWFPACCLACGGSLPEWGPATEAATYSNTGERVEHRG